MPSAATRRENPAGTTDGCAAGGGGPCTAAGGTAEQAMAASTSGNWGGSEAGAVGVDPTGRRRMPGAEAPGPWIAAAGQAMTWAGPAGTAAAAGASGTGDGPVVTRQAGGVPGSAAAATLTPSPPGLGTAAACEAAGGARRTGGLRKLRYGKAPSPSAEASSRTSASCLVNLLSNTCGAPRNPRRARNQRYREP